MISRQPFGFAIFAALFGLACTQPVEEEVTEEQGSPLTSTTKKKSGGTTLGSFQVTNVTPFGARFFVTKGHDKCGGRDYDLRFVNPAGVASLVDASTYCPYATAFDVSVRGLKPSTTYTVTLELPTACGTAAPSAPRTITTPVASPEQNPPVLGTLEFYRWGLPPYVGLTVQDDTALDRAEFWMDGVLQQTKSWADKGIRRSYGSGDSQYAWTTWPTGVSGSHSWEARVFDAFGNEAVSSGTFSE